MVTSMKYPMKKVDNKEPIAAAVLVTPNIIEAYFGHDIETM